MLDPSLDIGDAPAGVALVPGAIELFGGGPKLHDEIARQVLRCGLSTFLPPEAHQSGFIRAHDDPGVRAANEAASADGITATCEPYQQKLLINNDAGPMSRCSRSPGHHPVTARARRQIGPLYSGRF